MIPEEKSAAVTLGLNETFGVTEFEDIRDLTERPGSNRAFRIIVAARLEPGLSHYRARICIPAADQHALRRYDTSLHLHAGGGRCSMARIATIHCPSSGRRSARKTPCCKLPGIRLGRVADVISRQ